MIQILVGLFDLAVRIFQCFFPKLEYIWDGIHQKDPYRKHYFHRPRSYLQTIDLSPYNQQTNPFFWNISLAVFRTDLAFKLGCLRWDEEMISVYLRRITRIKYLSCDMHTVAYALINVTLILNNSITF